MILIWIFFKIVVYILDIAFPGTSYFFVPFNSFSLFHLSVWRAQDHLHGVMIANQPDSRETL